MYDENQKPGFLPAVEMTTSVGFMVSGGGDVIFWGRMKNTSGQPQGLPLLFLHVHRHEFDRVLEQDLHPRFRHNPFHKADPEDRVPDDLS
mgnify:CR=1 FL=1